MNMMISYQELVRTFPNLLYVAVTRARKTLVLNELMRWLSEAGEGDDENDAVMPDDTGEISGTE